MRIIILFLFIITVIPIFASIENTKRVDKDFSDYFYGFDGCFLLYNEKKDEMLVYNRKKAEKPLSPCSTFKIVNGLVGLETGAIKDKDKLIKWNGMKYPNATQNRDHNLSTAMRYSVVWYFEMVAVEIGKEKMDKYLKEIGYGNNDTSGGDLLVNNIDGMKRFWIQSSLKISPNEMMEFIYKFYNYKLPFEKKNIDIIKSAIIDIRNSEATLSGKTGTGNSKGKDINGWYVGYLEKGDDVYYFVTNIEGAEGANSWKAKSITKNILKDMKLFIEK